MSPAPIRFDRFQHQALYGPNGFYNRGGAAGAVNDFMTSVEASSSFAEALTVELDALWHRLGCPNPFLVAEGGSGVGSLALQCLAARTQCREALHWVMIETSVGQRALAAERLEQAGLLDDGKVSYAAELRQLGDGPSVHAVVANELLDNLAVRVVRRDDHDTFSELYVDPSEPSIESWQRLDGNDLVRCTRHATNVQPGCQFPLADRAVAWTWAALERLVDGGQAILIDYGADTAELSQRPERGWLRFYRGHQRRSISDATTGGVDITADVPFDQLPGKPTLTSQRRWLIERLPELARPAEMGQMAITDPHGMGGFVVATWTKA